MNIIYMSLFKKSKSTLKLRIGWQIKEKAVGIKNDLPVKLILFLKIDKWKAYNRRVKSRSPIFGKKIWLNDK